MADFTTSKPAGAVDPGTAVEPSTAPADAIQTSFNRLRPLITARELHEKVLFGLPLTSRWKDPETGRFYKITDDMLDEIILDALTQAEDETHLTLAPTQFSQKIPYSMRDFQQFGYMQLMRRPISSIESLTVTLADGSDIFDFPLQWVETANLIRGQLNLIPLAFQNIGAGGVTGIIGSTPSSNGGTAVFFNSLWNRAWVAALFGVKYTAGFKDMMFPRNINRLVGIIAGMMTLSQLAAANARATSTSLNMDGMGQSVGTPGPQIYKERMLDLVAERKLLVGKLRKEYGTKFVTDAV